MSGWGGFGDRKGCRERDIFHFPMFYTLFANRFFISMRGHKCNHFFFGMTVSKLTRKWSIELLLNNLVFVKHIKSDLNKLFVTSVK